MQFIEIRNFTCEGGAQYDVLALSYQVFGQPLHSAPVILVNHALTGNSDVLSEERGWWRDLAGSSKLLNTEKYTIIAFNIPGNGYDGSLISSYRDWTAKDVARLFCQGLDVLGVDRLFVAIGGSLGGGIAWEIAGLRPAYIDYLIPVASDWKASDWIIGHNAIQESILLNSTKPLEDARKMAMLFYRSPESFRKRFQRKKSRVPGQFDVVSWLEGHADKIKQRFKLQAYLMMNHLLTTLDASAGAESFEDRFAELQSVVIQIAVRSDIFFNPEENERTREKLDYLGIRNHLFIVDSDDGHDAFLIEHKQITNFLNDFLAFKSYEDLKVRGQVSR